MDTQFVVGWTIAVATVAIGYLFGLIHAGMWRAEKSRPLQPNPEPLPTLVKKRPEPKPELGAVKRPDAEDIDKKTHPILKEEEEAWEEDINKLT